MVTSGGNIKVSGTVNTMHFVEIATTGNSQDFGDLQTLGEVGGCLIWSRRFIMSQINIRNLSNENDDGSPEIVGVSTFSATSFFVPPKGTTAERPSDCIPVQSDLIQIHQT